MEIVENFIGVVFVILTGQFAYASAIMVDEKQKYINKHGRENYIKGLKRTKKK